MSHITDYYIGGVQSHADAGHDVSECYGDSYVTGNNATGFQLVKSGNVQGIFTDATTAMQHLRIVATAATAVPIGRA